MTVALGVAFPAAHGAVLPEDFTIEGRLYDNTGAPLSTNVDFKIELFDEQAGNGACVLYRELRTGIDLSATDPTSVGVFSLRLGAVAPDFSAGPLAAVFAPGALGGEGCMITAPAGSHRLVHIEVKKSTDSTFEHLLPDTKITSVPLAKVAETALTLQGLGTSSLVIQNTSTQLLQSNLESVFSNANYPKLTALLNGSSTQYLATTPGQPISAGNTRLTNLLNPTAPQDAATKSYVDGSLGGSPVDVTAVGPMLGNKNVLQWDSTANKWVAAAVDTSPTGAAGGALTGTYPNPTLANDVISAANVKSSGGGQSRLLITDATTGAFITYGVCTLNQVYAWTTGGWACTNVGSLSPVSSVAGRTGAVTLSSTDVSGLGSAATFNVGTSAGQIPSLDATGALPAVSGANLTQVNAVKLQSRSVATIAPADAQVLTWNASLSVWAPANTAVVGVKGVAAGNGLLGGPIASVGTLAVDVGTAPGKIPQINGSTQLALADGSAPNPPYAFAADAGAGMYHTSVGALGLATGGAARVMITGTGLIGIGTLTPAYPLDVVGTIRGTTVCLSTDCRSAWPTSTATTVASANSDIGVATTAGPTVTLTLNSGTSANQIVKLNGIAQLPAVNGALLSGLNASNITTGTMSWAQLANPGGDVTSSGSPGNLRVTGLYGRPVTSVAPTAGNVLTWNGTAWTPNALASTNLSDAGIVITNGGTALTSGYLTQATGSNLIKTSPVYVNSGRIGIGTVTPTAQLHVFSGGQTESKVSGDPVVMTYENTSTSGRNWLLATGTSLNNGLRFQQDAATPTLFLGSTTDYGATRVGIGMTNPSYELDVAGIVHAINFSTSSDVRWKRDITALTDPLDRVLQMRGVTYFWIDEHRGTTEQLGLIAQEVQRVYPQVVTSDAKGFLSLDYSHLIAPIIEAIKALHAMVESDRTELVRLREENARLNERLADIERRLGQR